MRHPFGLDGAQYEIDLSDDNAAALREELARFIASSRRTGGRKAIARTAPTAEDRERSQAIRAWAVANDWPISDRGRIPREVADAYEEARNETAKSVRERAAKKQPPNSGRPPRSGRTGTTFAVLAPVHVARP
ncbi:histone-like nucleoid-structuring protein Lsr2 [Amycolatopsis sp. GA6-003]|uniref:histone-like nucleoid-structuring protein Lsr2 n=1 Tax=Amycolatopsis sp. GA6-003 TaxID=2652444 RepID=UPI0039174C03